ncbi:DUF6801 domain-containing protein [Streptomyces polyrhachis]|uniref:DUF6801 domain-containing protein n=1 Tax=Streptomyces polyrhachis TaxID=1282885 RepID=A0ABW2GD98_9ACTN
MNPLMVGRRTGIRRPLRGSARLSVAAAFVVLAATTPGAGAAPADAAQQVDVEMLYRCQFPMGERSVPVRIRAELPARVKPGEQIQPTEVTTEVELGEGIAADFRGRGVTSIAAKTHLTVDFRQGADEAEAQWDGEAEVASLPTAGAMTLKAVGAVPTATPGAAGKLTLYAAALRVEIASAMQAQLTDPIGIDCMPDVELILATLLVGEDSDPEVTPSDDFKTRHPSKNSKIDHESAPIGSPMRTGDDADIPPCRYTQSRIPERAADPTFLLATSYVVGYANVQKLKGAALLPLSCVQIDYPPKIDFPFVPEGCDADLDMSDCEANLIIASEGITWFEHKGKLRTAPTQASFLAFGFAPVTATVQLEQVGESSLTTKLRFPLDFSNSSGAADIDVPFIIRTSAASVNGTPINIGPGCRTSGPAYSRNANPGPGGQARARVSGFAVGDFGYTLNGGGMLSGEITIPPFIGCGKDGEYNDLFTALVSGPGNRVKASQGLLCLEQESPDPAFCGTEPWKIPQPFTEWTVTPNAASLSMRNIGPVEYGVEGSAWTCPTASLDGSASSAEGAPGDIGRVHSDKFGKSGSPCVGPMGSHVIKSDGTPWRFRASKYDSAAGILTGYLRSDAQIPMNYESCTYWANGTIPATYDNSTGILTLDSTGGEIDPNSRLAVFNYEGECSEEFSKSPRIVWKGKYKVNGPVEIVGH